MRTLTALAIAALLALIPAAQLASAHEPDAENPLDALAWLEGKWGGSHDDKRWEEHWSSPAAGAMCGMFRMLDADRVIVYELLLIELGDDDTPTYRLRHFGAKMKPWEDEPITLALAESSPEHILFRNTTPGQGPAYIRYTRNGDDAIDVWVGASPTPGKADGFSLPVTRMD